MPDNPLSTPVDDWTRDDLDELIGRAETEYFELKGSDIVLDGSGRRDVARALAGMISASGGYVVIGTVPGEDHVSAYPGLDVSLDQVENFRRSLQDRVRPSPIAIRGPKLLPADDPDLSVLVIQVFRHPAGLPASADGRYWLRTRDETRPMDYDEVRRRIEAATSATDAASARSRKELETIGSPIWQYYQDELRRRGMTEVAYSPFRLAIVPLTGFRDLGLTGAELQRSLRAAGDSDAEAYESASGLQDALIDLSGESAVVVDGLDYDSTVPFRRIRFHHDGVFAAAANLLWDPWDDGVSINPREFETFLVRMCSIGLRLIHETVGPSTLHVAATSGVIPRVVGGSRAWTLDEPTSAKHSFETASQGPDAVDAVLKGARVLATRVSETHTRGVYGHAPWLEDYASAILGW